MRLAAAVTVALVMLPGAAARAAFEAPVQLATGGYGTSVTGAVDEAGRATAVMAGVRGGTQIAQRPSAGVPWAPSVPLAGAVGPTVAASGHGALAVAWRIDKPMKYAAIAALAADASGVLGAPVVVSDPDAGGVRHPAVAIDRFGHAALAYNTGTRAVHLSLAGAVALSLRDVGGTFRTPVVVDRHASARPAVSIADDGAGIAAWTHDRRVWALSFDARAGTVGKVVALTGAGAHASVVAAAGPGGAATVAWLGRGAVEAAHRGGGTRFGRSPLRIAVPGYTRTLVASADGQGTTTLAWTERTFSRDRSVGINGVTASVRSATISGVARRFEPVVEHVAPGDVDCATPSVAARDGNAVVAWACQDRRTATVWEQRAADGGAPSSVLSYKLNARARSTPAPVTVGLDGDGTATVFTTTTDQPDPAEPQVTHVLATTGR